MTKKGGERYEHIQLICMFHSKESTYDQKRWRAV